MIPFLDLKAQYAGIKDELDKAVLGVLASTQYVLDEEVAAFEREFADYCGVKHAIAVNTGTSALHLALLAAGIGPDDEGPVAEGRIPPRLDGGVEGVHVHVGDDSHRSSFSE